MATYEKISKIIKEEHPEATIQYRDAKSYFTILQKNIRKWFIRLHIEDNPHWISFRHIRPEAAQALCPGITVVDGKQNGDSLIFLTEKIEIQSIKNLILASYKAELDRANDQNETIEAK